MINQKKPNTELKKAIMQSKHSFIFAGFFSFFINLLMLVPPLYMLQLYDRVVTSRSLDTLTMLTLIVVVLFVTMGLLELVRSRLLVVISNQIDTKLSDRVFNAMFALSSKVPGRASSQASSDLNQIKQYLTGNGIFAFLDAPWFPIYLAILFLFHPIFGYFAIFAAIVLFILAVLNDYTTKKGLDESNEFYRKEMRFLEANLRNSEVIHAMGMQKNIKALWDKKHTNFLQTHTSASNQAGIWANLSKTSRTMFQSLMLGLGAYLVVKMQVSPGMMIAGSIIMGRALAPLDMLIASWKNFKSAKTAYARLSAFLEDFPEVAEPMPLPEPEGNISLESIYVIPPGSKQPVVNGVSLEVNKGDIVAIIGPSAAGKSSLAKAALGIWPLHLGKVRIDKADIENWDRVSLGKFLGYLPQDIELFEGTISENIARFNEINPQLVVKAAMMAGVHDMILSLPQGYDTKIGVGGATLSGGQRQRVGLARALYDDPKVVVLDEPNSNLDELGEMALVEAIKHLKANNTTVILITHRLNILEVVDKIALMQNGRVVQYGYKNQVLQQLSQPAKEPQKAITKKRPTPVVSLTTPEEE